MISRNELVKLLMRISEFKLPLFFWEFSNASAMATDVLADKESYIRRQIGALSDDELQVLVQEINRESNNAQGAINLSTEETSTDKSPKIFISHSSKDKSYADKLVDFLEDLGVDSNDQLFCSSTPGYGIGYRKNIYDELKDQFKKYKLEIIYLLSSNFYTSPAALNEMGAAWILQTEHHNIALPGFKFDDIKGCLEPEKSDIGIDLAATDESLKEMLREFYDTLKGKFMLPNKQPARWETIRDKFISGIQDIANAKP